MMQNTTQALRHLQKTIGLNIHTLRREKKLTLQKLSQRTGISITLLDQYELGRNQMHLYPLICIATALGTHVECLMQRHG